MGWTTVFEYTPAHNETASATRNHRQIVAADLSAVNGTKIRVTCKAADGYTVTIAGASIGAGASGDTYDAAPTRITFDGGNSGASLSAGQTKLSDEITFAFDKTLRYLIHVYSTECNFNYYTYTSQSYYNTAAGGDDTLTLNPATTAASSMHFIKLEVYNADAGNPYCHYQQM